jgi:hypothetical protein
MTSDFSWTRAAFIVKALDESETKKGQTNSPSVESLKPRSIFSHTTVIHHHVDCSIRIVPQTPSWVSAVDPSRDPLQPMARPDVIITTVASTSFVRVQSHLIELPIIIFAAPRKGK